MTSRVRSGAREFVRGIVVLSSAAALLLGVSAAGRYGWLLLAIERGNVPSRANIGSRATPAPPLTFVDLEAPRRDPVSLSLTQGRVLVLVYSTRCTVCDNNMPRWLDLIAELRRAAPTVPVYAIDIDLRDSSLTYWPRVDGVRVLMPADRKAFLQTYRVPGTPATLVTHAGVVDATMLGMLGSRQRSYLVSLLSH